MLRQRRPPSRSRPHLDFIRSLPCAVAGCTNGPIEAAHVRRGTDGGTALKPSDIWTIPVCHFHHAEVHRIGEAAFARQTGIDLRALAAELANLSSRGPMP